MRCSRRCWRSIRGFSLCREQWTRWKARSTTLAGPQCKNAGRASRRFLLCAFEFKRRWNVLCLRPEFQVRFASHPEFDLCAVDDVAVVEPRARVRLAVEGNRLDVLVRGRAALGDNLKLPALAHVERH